MSLYVNEAAGGTGGDLDPGGCVAGTVRGGGGGRIAIQGPAGTGGANPDVSGFSGAKSAAGGAPVVVSELRGHECYVVCTLAMMPLSQQ
jgi:hypothetical protein